MTVSGATCAIAGPVHNAITVTATDIRAFTKILMETSIHIIGQKRRTKVLGRVDRILDWAQNLIRRH